MQTQKLIITIISKCCLLCLSQAEKILDRMFTIVVISNRNLLAIDLIKSNKIIKLIRDSIKMGCSLFNQFDY